MPQSTQVNVPKGLIDLGIGQPGFDLLPLAEIRRATAARLAADDMTLLNYGHEPGDGRFLAALATYLTTAYAHDIDPAHLFLTAGTSQGLDLICTRFTRPGDAIFVEEPSYFLALDIFANHHLAVVGVPIDGDGLDLDALEATLARRRPAFLYTIPTFHNPSAVTLAADRRARLLALSRAHDFLVVADEVYQLLPFGPPPPASLALLPGANRVLSLGTFSKILAPGLRLGWVHTTPALRERLVASGVVQSGGSLNHFTSAIVHTLLDQGLQATYLARLVATYRRRAAALDAALQAHLPPGVTYTRPEGGFFFWLRLPPARDAAALLPAARAAGVSFQPGARFSSNGGLANYLRLSFAFYGEAELAEGAARLGAVLAGG